MNTIKTAEAKTHTNFTNPRSPALGDIPKHWRIESLSTSVEAQINGVWGKDPNGTDDLPCIRVADFDRENHRIRTDKLTLRSVTPSERAGRILRKGDLLLEKSGGGEQQPVGTVVLYDHDFEAVCSNFVGRMVLREGYNPTYLTYLHATLYAIGVNKRSIKQTTGIQNIDHSSYLSELVGVPPPDEQAAIVRYLDAADQKIQAYISAKEKLIALLEEQRQAIIHQAVTRGLDPYVKLKSSGVNWLGDVPEHWEHTRLKQVATIQGGITLGKEYKGEELIERPYLRVANVQSGHLDLSEITTVRITQSEINKTTLQNGDVLMTEGGDIDKLGRGCMWLGEVEGCLHQNHVFAVRPNRKNLNPAFLMALMETPQGRNYFHSTAKQTTNLAATNRTTLGEFPMYLPKEIEQQTIADYISEKAAQQTTLIGLTRRQIKLMEEYRTRLIADVVTGKLDVRKAAEELPQLERTEITT